MKKFFTLILAAGMIVSTGGGASAASLKVSGQWLTAFHVTDNLYGANALKEGSNDGKFKANQRIRINLDMVANESLSGRVQLQVGNGASMPHAYDWGTGGVGSTGKDVTARLAYLDWVIPGTDTLVRMGRQEVDIPSYTFLSPVFDTPSAIDGVMTYTPVNDMLAFTVGWLRASATLNKWGTAHYPHSSVDLAYLSADLKFDGVRFTPWGIVGLHGNGEVDDKGTRVGNMDMMGYGYSTVDEARTTVYWVGAGGELTMFDPFRFTADFVYSGNDADGTAGRRGWYAALGAELKTGFGTPFLKGWYASGDDADSEKSERLMSISRGGLFDASTIYFDGMGMLSQPIDNQSAAGTWGMQLGVKGISFVEALTHMLSVTYIQGTNNTNRITNPALRGQLKNCLLVDDTPARYMTTSDSAWEIDFLSTYKLYKNFSASLMLAYLITDFDENIRADRYDNAFRGTLMFTYNF